MPVGEVKSSEIGKNRDGDLSVRLLQVEISDPDDLQTVQLMTAGGDDYSPPDGSIAVIVKSGDSWKMAVAVDDNVEPADDLEKGERELYSSDGGARKAKLRLKKDGQQVLNDGGDTAVAFSRLQTAFDQLKSDFDALVAKYNPHVHPVNALPGPSPIPTAVTTSTGSPTTADIAPAESPTVELP